MRAKKSDKASENVKYMSELQRSNPYLLTAELKPLRA
jgi:hypothetical protein